MKEDTNAILPRVLVISHNSFSDTQNNGKTLSAFFRGWESNKLAQIYLTTDIPDFSVCKFFFQIHDFDIIMRLVLKGMQGRIVDEQYVSTLKSNKEKVKNSFFLGVLRKMIGPGFRFARDVLWWSSGFKTKKLKAFIDEFSPNVVFFQSSNGVFAFMLVKWICIKYNIPLVMQTTDDYVTKKVSFNPFFWIQYFRIVSIYKWAVKYASSVIAIGEDMSTEYSIRFGGNYKVAMNAVELARLPEKEVSDSVIRFLYAGNLGLNRWKVLALISECLSEIYVETGLRGELSVYSLTKPERVVLTALERPSFCSFKGAASIHDLSLIKGQSDVLVHVEAFDEQSIYITRLSISTKIPEYLAAGKCIYAVGPQCVASIKYISRNNLGFYTDVQDKESIKNTLIQIMSDKDKRVEYAKNGLVAAQEKHSPSKTADLVRSLMVAAVIDANLA